MIYKIPIPQFYIWLTQGYSKRGQMFRSYVKGYLAKSYPDLKLVKIKGMIAICERCEAFEEWKSAHQEAKNRNKRRRSKSK